MKAAAFAITLLVLAVFAFIDLKMPVKERKVKEIALYLVITIVAAAVSGMYFLMPESPDMFALLESLIGQA